jgi:hypothetical protein
VNLVEQQEFCCGIPVARRVIYGLEGFAMTFRKLRGAGS